MKKILLVALTLVSVKVFAAEPFEKFCSEVPGWAPGTAVPDKAKYAEAKLGQTVDAKFLADNYTKEDWVLIDARSEGDRATGKVPKAVLITADSKDPKGGEFTEEILLKRLGDHFKGKVKTVADLKTKKIGIFCNGLKCHRTSAGACILRKMGIPYENVYLLLGGFPEWKDGGHPVR